MTGQDLASQLLERVEEKIRLNKQPIVTYEELAGMLRAVLGLAEPEIARPKPIPQTPIPEMQPGEWRPGVGRYTGS